jgi:hypothetical protein
LAMLFLKNRLPNITWTEKYYCRNQQHIFCVIYMLFNIKQNTACKFLKSLPRVTQRPILFHQFNTVILQFHILSSLAQDIGLVAVKTNSQILYYVTGAQEIPCYLKFCNFLITSSAFMQHHSAHIPICSHPCSHSFFHTQYMTKQCIYKTCTNTRHPCSHSVSLHNTTITRNALQQFYCYIWSYFSPFKNYMH